MSGADGHAGLAAAERLRRLAEVLSADGGPDAVWAASAVRRYLASPAQLDLDAAFGLAVRPGAVPWWRLERDAERDRLIRSMAADLTGTPHARASVLQRRLRHYAGSSWLRDRVSRTPTTANAVLYQIFTLDPEPPTGIRRLTEILTA